MSVHLIAGGAGFIGFTLISRLLEADQHVIAVDDLSRGSLEPLSCFGQNPHFQFARADCNDLNAFRQAIAGVGRIDHLWHLAANSDIPAGVSDPRIDLERTFMTTFNLLLLMREAEIPQLHFASSSAIYGDLGNIRISEDSGPIEPISNYGAMKLASEAQIRAAVESWLPRANVFRFPNVVGVPATHGVILDFIRKLKADPTVLPVLGDGSQQKAYLHVAELVDAMLLIQSKASTRYNVFNIGPDDVGVTVRFIAEAVRDCVAPGARIEFGQGGRGWVGDVPKFRYSVDRLKALGWQPRLGSAEAIILAVDEIANQEIQLACRQ